MKDPRLEKLAEVLLTHSVKIKENEKVMIAGDYVTKPLMKELVQKAYDLGAIPYFEFDDQELMRIMATNANAEQMILQNKWNMETISGS